MSELVADSDSDEVRVSSDVSSVGGKVSSGEGSLKSVAGVSQPQLYHETASCHTSSSSISSYASDEDAG
jgi:hypothetical protein